MRALIVFLGIMAPAIASATTLPLDGVLKTSGSQITGESKFPFSKGKIYFSAGSGLTCKGEFRWPSIEHDIAKGTVTCSDGRSGEFTLHTKNPHEKGWADGVLSDGEQFSFSIGKSIVPGTYVKFMKPGTTYKYVGKTEVEGLIIDPDGVPPEKYQQHVTDCLRFRKQAEGSLVGDAIAGAILGSAAASIAGDEYSRTKSAQLGAVASMAEGADESDAMQEKVLRNCLAGRGLRVLN